MSYCEDCLEEQEDFLRECVCGGDVCEECCAICGLGCYDEKVEV